MAEPLEKARSKGFIGTVLGLGFTPEMSTKMLKPVREFLKPAVEAIPKVQLGEEKIGVGKLASYGGLETAITMPATRAPFLSAARKLYPGMEARGGEYQKAAYKKLLKWADEFTDAMPPKVRNRMQRIEIGDPQRPAFGRAVRGRSFDKPPQVWLGTHFEPEQFTQVAAHEIMGHQLMDTLWEMAEPGTDFAKALGVLKQQHERAYQLRTAGKDLLGELGEFMGSARRTRFEDLLHEMYRSSPEETFARAMGSVGKKLTRQNSPGAIKYALKRTVDRLPDFIKKIKGIRRELEGLRDFAKTTRHLRRIDNELRELDELLMDIDKRGYLGSLREDIREVAERGLSEEAVHGIRLPLKHTHPR